MPCGKKRKKRKMNTHKRKKRLRADRHKKKNRYIKCKSKVLLYGLMLKKNKFQH
jgi:hypothetical protein